MKRIQQLSRQLINQIAAGEVIERPASVVKEMVENSIDAGATRIEVEASKDCLSLRISDNGSGIHPDDIELAFSKHATSKISSADDLFKINTNGFRGEALASIISIAKVTCITRTEDFETGTKAECAESEVKKTPFGCAVGTTMEIKDLFYNTPARQKFLKSERVELSYISEVLQSIAIANPSIAITLIYDGKTPVKTSGSGDLLCTLTEIYSNSIASELKEISKVDELSGLFASGFCSTPEFTRSSKKSIYIFVNDRVVKCPVAQKAIDVAYKSMLPAGRYPFVCINIKLPTEDVDVNVHPTKKEVRYRNPNQIFNFVHSSIQGALASYKTEISEQRETALPFGGYNSSIQPANAETNVSNEADDVVYVSSTDYETTSAENRVEMPNEVQTSFFKNEHKKPESQDYQRQYEMNVSQIDFDLTKTAQVEENFRIIGQYHNTYILFEEDGELKLVDQHIADERYIFEKLQAEIMTKENGEIPSQLILISDVLTLENADVELIMENSEKLKRFGYAIEKISDTEVIFKKIPQVIAHLKVSDIITDILENLHGNLNNLEEKMLITMSCKAAVKAGAELNLWQMEELIKKWKTTKLPYTCPHGRPILHTFTEKEIAGLFNRNVAKV